MKKTVISHLIKPDDLQHHGTLFAGRMAEWVVETCFIAASRLLGKPEDILCVQIHGISFKRPANNGDIIEIQSRVAYLGAKSITVHCQAFINEENEASVSGMVTFATVDKHRKPYEHGLKLSEDYITRHHTIHEEALRVRRSQ